MAAQFLYDQSNTTDAMSAGSTVLVKRIVILRSGDCAAAGGDDVSARLTQTADRLVLDAAESFLAVLPDNVGGCATTQADDFLVRVGEFLA